VYFRLNRKIKNNSLSIEQEKDGKKTRDQESGTGRCISPPSEKSFDLGEWSSNESQNRSASVAWPANKETISNDKSSSLVSSSSSNSSGRSSSSNSS